MQSALAFVLSLFSFVSVMSVATLMPVVSVAQSECAKLVDYKSVIKCAEQRSPKVKAGLLELEKIRANSHSAAQWNNPELSAESYQDETQIHLGVPIEFGKVSSRKAVAQGELLRAQAELLQIRHRVKSEIYLKLHRLRQVLHEQEILDEAVGTFSKLVKQYARRPKLSPDQELSMSVFQLSKSEYELKRASNQDEFLALNSYLKLVIGPTGSDIKNDIKDLVPDVPTSWPVVKENGEVESSPEGQILDSTLESAKGRASLAQSEAWPTLTVGPSVKWVDEPGRKDELYGFNVSLPLPIFNWNQGARSAAHSEVSLNEFQKKSGLEALKLKRSELYEVYSLSVKVLSESLSHSQIEKKHVKAERLFLKGVVPSALVIETHRTTYELEKVRHERELKALEALLGIYNLDGNLLEMDL